MTSPNYVSSLDYVVHQILLLHRVMWLHQIMWLHRIMWPHQIIWPHCRRVSRLILYSSLPRLREQKLAGSPHHTLVLMMRGEGREMQGPRATPETWAFQTVVTQKHPLAPPKVLLLLRTYFLVFLFSLQYVSGGSSQEVPICWPQWMSPRVKGLTQLSLGTVISFFL